MDPLFDKDVKIVFDTNCWLGIYRTRPDTIKLIISELRKDIFFERICIPAFVDKEFSKHKYREIHDHKKLKENIANELENTIEDINFKLINKINFLKERHKVYNEKIEEKINKNLLSIKKLGNEFLKEINTSINIDDNAYLEVEKLFNEIKAKNLMNELTKDEVLFWFTKGEERYDKKTPPGFEDKEKEKKGGFIYGDLIIWEEIVKYAKKNKTDILFITNDTKKDWFSDGNFNEKLVKEFNAETNQNITGICLEDFYIKTAIHEENNILAFIKNVFHELRDNIERNLMYEGSEIFNSFEILTDYSGDYYDLVDTDIGGFDEINYTIDYVDNFAEIKISIPVSAKIKTGLYSGKDDGEVIIYPYYIHQVSGIVSFTIAKNLSELIYNISNYEIADVESTIKEDSYDLAEECKEDFEE